MKKEHGYLIASIFFLIGAIAIFLSDMDNKVVFGSALATLGIAFMAIFVNKIKK
jgi:hypothetical protein